VAWYTVVLLSCAYLVSMIDRIVLSMVVTPIKAELLLSDTQMGLLLGTAFGLFYALMGLPMGRLVDRFNRRNLIIAGLLAWSLMTLASGLAANYWQLFIARMGVGIGEAILAPAAWSMIADLFPPHRRAKPVGVFYIGGSVGVGIALVASTLLLNAASSGVLVDVFPLSGLSGWRVVLILAGLPGIVLAMLLLSVREPSRTALADRDGDTERPTLQQVTRYVWSNRGSLLLFYVGMGFVALTAYSTMSWAPTAMYREFDVPITEIGYLYGLVILLITPWATPLGGALTDRRVATGADRVYLKLPLACAVGVAAVHLLFGFAPTFAVALLALAGFNFFYYAAQAPAAGYTLHIVPGSMRGLVSSLYVLIINMIGLTLGPPLVAVVSGAIDPSGSALAPALAIVCGCSALIGGLCLWLARHSTYELFSGGRRQATVIAPALVR
jgi:MFS family permease